MSYYITRRLTDGSEEFWGGVDSEWVWEDEARVFETVEEAQEELDFLYSNNAIIRSRHL